MKKSFRITLENVFRLLYKTFLYCLSMGHLSSKKTEFLHGTLEAQIPLRKRTFDVSFFCFYWNIICKKSYLQILKEILWEICMEKRFWNLWHASLKSQKNEEMRPVFQDIWFDFNFYFDQISWKLFYTEKFFFNKFLIWFFVRFYILKDLQDTFSENLSVWRNESKTRKIF